MRLQKSLRWAHLLLDDADLTSPFQERSLPEMISKLDLQDVFRDVSRARQSALVLDYDGTLAPFQLNRAEAVPYEGVSQLLQQIISTGRCRVVFVTGRRAEELIPLLGLTPQPEIWGIHGLERLHTDGSLEVTPVDPDTLDALAAAEDWVENLNLHKLVEQKSRSLAVHWRGMSDEEAQQIRNRVLLGWLSIADRTCLNVEEFDGGIELRVAHRNKGDALRTILTELEVDAPIAYLGDDQTDEDAFRILRDRGLCVLVRPQWRETAAKLWLRPPGQLLTFFRIWLDACRRTPASRPHGPWASDYDTDSSNDRGEDGQQPEL
jgi:trehalose 6-phosphate phosphatase